MSDKDSLAGRAFAGVGIGLVVGIALGLAVYAAGGWFDAYEHRSCTTSNASSISIRHGLYCHHDTRKPTVTFSLAIATALPPGLLCGLAVCLLWREI